MKRKGLIIFDVIMSLTIMLSMCISVVAHNNQIGLSSQKLMSGNGNRSFSFVAAPEYQKVLAGATVTIDLKLEDIEMGEQGLNNVVGYLSYDEDVFEQVNISGKEDWIFEINQDKTHDMYGKFVIYTMSEGVTENTDVATITLKLKDNLEPQTTELNFTGVKSSDGQVPVDAADKTATIEVYEDTPVNPSEPANPDGPVNPDEPVNPDGPVTPAKPGNEPNTPEQKTEEKSEQGSSYKAKSIKTGDTIFITALALLMATVAINVLVVAGNKDDDRAERRASKVGLISAIAIIVLGLTMICTASFAHSAEIQALIDNLSGTEKWLDSESYLVTDTAVSRIAPLTNIDGFDAKFNKNIEIHKSGSNEVVMSGNVATGMTIHAGSEAQTLCVLGDLDGDGDSNQVELTRIIRNVVAPATNTFSNTEKLSADLSVDGNVDGDDIDKSVNYILYGTLDIPTFTSVEAPILTVVGGTYNSVIEAYEDTIQVKISKQDSTAATLKYKIEGTSTVEYTEIENNGTIELPNNGVYKISAYNYGALGNRSAITSQIFVKKSPNNSYTVKTKSEKADGTYEETTETKSGRIGETVTASYIVPEGYELNSEASTLSGTVQENEVTELTVAFDRKSYNLTVNAGDYISAVKIGDEQNSTTITKSFKFGTTVSIDATISELAGYSTNFDRWTSSDTSVLANIGTKEAEFEMPKSNITLTATADRVSDTDTRYKVEYYYQENGVYPATATSSKNKNGETDTTAEVDATDKTPTSAGYVLDESRNENWSGNVAGDNSLVLKVYFKQQFTVTYKPGTQGTFSEQKTEGIEFGTATPEFTGTLSHNEGYDFDGWEPTQADVVRANAEYVAKWKDHTYGILYVLDGGSLGVNETTHEPITNPSTYTISSDTFTLNNPTKTGYTFTGWSGTGIDGLSSSVTIEQGSTGDRTYTANWEVIDYSISYNLNGGSLGTDETTGDEITNPTGYNAETETFTLNNPKKAGYVFDGWTGTEHETAVVTVTIEKGSTGDRSYVANWRASTTTPYHVKYYLENLAGDGYDLKADVPLSGTTGTEVTATKNTYTGFTLDESKDDKWSATIAGEGTTVLEVYYSRNSYALTLTKDDDITSVTGANTYKYQAPVSVSATLKTETGYTIEFVKWESSDEDLLESKFSSSAEFTMPAGDFTLAAISRRTANTVDYTLETYFQVNGAYSSIADSTVTRQAATGTPVSASSDDKTTEIEGYVLDESKNESWSGTVAGDGSTVLKVFFKQQFTITYKPGAHGTFAEQKTEHLDYGAATPEFTGSKNAEPGYEFTAWDKTVENTVTESVKYVATWNKIGYTISYELNGGSLGEDETTHEPITNKTSYDVETASFTLNNPTRTGYTFLGWTGTDHDTATMAVTIAQGSTGDRSYTANWEVITYDIDYNLNGGRLATGVTNQATYNIETPTFRLNNPTRIGYTFLGWTGTDQETATDELDVAQGSTGDRSYTANWEANSGVVYHVKYYLESLESTDSTDENNYIMQENVEEEGTTGQTVNAEVKSYTGFTHYAAHPNAIESGEIAGDGSLVLKVFYKRNSYDVQLTKDDNVDTVTGANTYRYGATVNIAATLKSFEGYTVTFNEWETESTSILNGDNDRKSATATFTMPAEDVILNATATKTANEVDYTVEYYYEGASGYSGTPTSTETRTAHVAETVEVTDADKTSTQAGYEFDSAASNVLSATIPTSGSVTLKVYFKKGTYTLTLATGDAIAEIQLGSDTAGAGETLTGSFKYGDSVTIDATCGTETGYEISFNKWVSSNPTLMADNTTKNLTFTMPAGDITLTATVNKVGLEAGYTVNYYYQLNGTYSDEPTNTITDRKGRTGDTAEITSADRVPITQGYAYDNNAPGKVESAAIAADGSTVLKVYYKQQFKVTFKPGEHGSFEEVSVRDLDYGTGIPSYIGTLEGSDGYIFNMWTLTKIGDTAFEEGMTVPTSVTADLEYTATWSPLPEPTVTHEPTTWTKDAVTVTITTPITGCTIEYSIDDSDEWNLYSDEFTVEQNCTIHARLAVDTNKGDEATHVIDNIDKTAPNFVSKTAALASAEGDEATVTVQATDAQSGIVEYGIKHEDYAGPTVYTCVSATSKEIVFDGLYENGTYEMYMKDAAGNTSTDTIEVTSIVSYKVAKIVDAPAAYASLVDQEYTTLAAALAASDTAAQAGNVKIQIIHDIPNETNTILSGRKYTINLDNYTIKNQAAQNVFTVQGDLTILDENTMGHGKVESTYGRGIYIVYNYPIIGKLTLGTDGDGHPSVFSPIVEGLTYGIEKQTDPNGEEDAEGHTPEGTFNFYDGKVIGGSGEGKGAFALQKIDDTPQMYDPTVALNEFTGKNEATLAIVSGFEAAIGKKRYTLLENAISDANYKISDSNTQVPITLVADISKESSVIVNESKNIKLDLNGHTFTTTSNDYVVKNYGQLEIVDSAESKVFIQEAELLEEYQDRWYYNSSSAYMGIYNKSPLTFNYDCPEAGEYTMVVTGTDIHKNVNVYVDGTLIYTITSADTTSGYKSVEISLGQLAKGNHVIKITCSSSIYYDSFTIYKTDGEYTKRGKIYSANNSTVLNQTQTVDSSSITYTNVDLSEKVNTGTYYFDTRAEGGLISNNTGVHSTTANSYVELDLTNQTGMYEISVDAAISSQKDSDFGYLTVRHDTLVPSRDASDGRKIYISSVSDTEYKFNLAGGQKYYLHMGYYKNGSGNSNNDCFIIRNIKYGKIPNSAKLTVSGGNIGTNKKGSNSNDGFKSAIQNESELYVKGGFVYAASEYTAAVHNGKLLNSAYYEQSGGTVTGRNIAVWNQITACTKLSGGNVTVASTNSDAACIDNMGGYYMTSVNARLIGGRGVYNCSYGKSEITNGFIRTYNAYGIYCSMNSAYSKEIMNVSVTNITYESFSSSGFIYQDKGYTKITNATVNKAGKIGELNSNGKIIIDNIDADAVDTSNVPTISEGITLNNTDALLIINDGEIYTKNTTITNYRGSVIMNGGNLRRYNNSDAVVNNSYLDNYTTSGDFTMNGGSITGPGKAVYNRQGGTVRINSGTVETTGNYSAITIGDTRGKIIIGENDGTVKTNVPVIKSNSKSAIDATSSTIDFFDGVLVGKQDDVVRGAVENIPDGYELICEVKADNLEYITLGIPSNYVAKIAASDTPNVSGMNTNMYKLDEGDNYYYFKSLDLAFSACTANPTTVILTDDMIIYRNLEVGETQQITLNLDGHTLKTLCSELVENNGNLIVTSTQASPDTISYGSIIAYSGTLINNKAGATVDIQYTDILYNGYREDSPYTSSNPRKLIDNFGNLNFYKSKYTVDYSYSTSKYGVCVYNENGGIVNIDSSTINSDTDYKIYNDSADTVDSNENTIYAVTIKNSVFGRASNENSYKSIYNNGTGTICINDGSTIAGSTYVYNESSGNIILKDSTLDAQYFYNEGTGYLEIDNSTCKNGTSSISIDNRSTGKVILKNDSQLTATVKNSNAAGTLEMLDADIFNNVNNSGICTIKKGTIISSSTSSDSIAIINQSGGILTVDDADIEIAASTGIKNSGTVTIYGGKVTGRRSHGINNLSGGTVTLGKKDNAVYYTPVIFGTNAGINNSGSLYFFDGIIEGKTNMSISGNTPTDTENNTSVIKKSGPTTFDDDTSEQYTVASGKDISVLEMADLAYVQSKNQAYPSLTQAFAAADTTDTITLLEDVSMKGNDATITILPGTDITLDLNNKNLAVSRNTAFINNGKFTIVDSMSHLDEDNKLVEGSVSTGGNVLLENNGTAIIQNGSYISNFGGTSSEYYNMFVNNTGTITFNSDGNYKLNASYSRVLCQNGGTVSINKMASTSGSKDTVCVYATAGTVNIATATMSYTGGYNIYNNGSADIVITDGSYSGSSDYGIYDNSDSGSTTINGGTYTCPVRNKKTGTVTITDGDFNDVRNDGTGTINVSGGVFNGANDNAIYNYSSGTIYITGGSFSAKYRVIRNSSGIIDIDGTSSTAENPITITSDAGHGIHNYNGTLNIRGHVEINTPATSGDASGIYSEQGAVTIGDKNNVNNDVKINSKKYGVSTVITNSVTFNYYGGTITAPTAVYGHITEIPNNYNVVRTVDASSNEVYEIGNLTGIVSVNGTPYSSISDAIANNASGTIKVEEDFVFDPGRTIEIPSGKSFVLDLNNHTLFARDKNKFFTNNGTFKINDLSVDAEGKIDGYIKSLVENNGTFELCGGTISGRQYDGALIQNNANAKIKVSGGNIDLYAVSVSNSYYTISNNSSEDINITGGNAYITSETGSWGSASNIRYINSTVVCDVNISGGTIECKRDKSNSSTIYLNGGGNVNISGNAEVYGRDVITERAGGTIEISDAAIVGGCIYAYTTSTVTINVNDGTVGSISTNNTANDTTANIYGGTVDRISTVKNVYIHSGVTVSTTNSNGAISDCINVTIDDATITGGINGVANLTMNSGTVTGTSFGIRSTGSNSATILGTKIEATAGPGIKLEGGTVILGVDDLNYPDQANPEIIGSTYGVERTGGTLNYYDGIIKGGTKAFSNSTLNKPSLFQVILNEDETEATLGIKATFTQVATVGGVYYNDLDSAINAAIQSNSELVLCKNITAVNPITIPADKSLTINLSAFSISAYVDSGAFIVNNGNLTIIDRTDDGYSTVGIRNYLDTAIDNNGTLTLGVNDSVVRTGAPKIQGTTVAIDNDGTLVFADGRIGITETTGNIISGSGTNQKPTGYSIHTEGNEMWLIADGD